jgi:hypothetical protein
MHTDEYAGKRIPGTPARKRITSSYGGSFLNVFYACVLQFYVVFSFYHKA